MADEKVILLVEDDEGHAHLMLKKLQREGIENEVIHLPDGQYAVDFLYAMGEFEGQDLPIPSVILLDLNMPRLNGVEVLATIAQDEYLSQIPVIVMTTSDQPDDINECRRYGYADYIIKPPDYPKLAARIREMM